MARPKGSMPIIVEAEAEASSRMEATSTLHLLYRKGLCIINLPKSERSLQCEVTKNPYPLRYWYSTA